jgi:hypothetical protein
VRLAALGGAVLLVVGIACREPPDDSIARAASIAQALAGFSDDFDDNSIDLSRWEVNAQPACTALEKNQRLEIACVAGCNNEYAQFITRNPIDLRGNEVVAELISSGDPGSQAWSPSFHLYALGDNRVVLAFGQGQIIIRNKLNGVTMSAFASTPLDGGQRWLRLRESAGTVYGETSPNGVQWITLGSEPAPFSLASVQVFLESGCSAPLGGANLVVFDNFNLPPGDAGAPDGGAANDAGASDAGALDAGSDGAGAPDAGEGPPYSVGCACEASSSTSPWFALSLLALTAGRRSRPRISRLVRW